MTEGKRYILGIDLGTTTIKGVLYDIAGTLAGTLIAQAAVTYPIRRDGLGRVEQDAAEWIDGMARIVERLFDGRALADLHAVGICSQVNTHVFVDAAGTPLMPAIVWQDDRAAAHAEAFDARISPEQRACWWQSAMAVSPTHTLPRAAWVQENVPEVWARTAAILSPKDFLVCQATGAFASDAPTSFDLVDGEGAYIPELIAFLPGLAERLPVLSDHLAVVGHGRHPMFGGAAPLVVNGTMDGLSGLFGSGAVRAGEGSYTSGTCEIIALIGDKPGSAPGVVSFMPVNGWHVHAGPTQSGGDTLRWLAGMFDCSFEEMLALAAQADRDTSEVLFLPHLGGERAPLWDVQARGSFLGLTSADGAPEMALAALEGVACSARLLLDAAVPAADRGIAQLYLGGGGNRSDLWAQIRADVMGIPLHRVACLETGAVGAAIMAGIGIGLFASIETASAALVEVEKVFAPDPARTARYSRMMDRFRAAYEALRPVYRM